MLARRARGGLLVLRTWALVAAACGADPAPTPVVMVDMPRADPAPPPPEEPPARGADRPEQGQAAEPSLDGGVYEFSFSGSFSTGDGGVDLSFSSATDGGVSLRATFGSDGGVLTFGSQPDDAGAPAPAPTAGPRARPDAGTRGR